MKDFMDSGKIVSAHGIKGEVKIIGDFSVISRAKNLTVGENGQSFRINSARPHKNAIIVKLSGINDMNTAESMRNKTVYVNRNEVKLPEGVYFVEDVLGLSVFDREGKGYGKITDIYRAGSSDVYTVTDEKGNEVMFPAIESCNIEIDLENRTLLFTPLEGLFD
jgi:16S rRNA processing protein RimM